MQRTSHLSSKLLKGFSLPYWMFSENFSEARTDTEKSRSNWEMRVVVATM